MSNCWVAVVKSSEYASELSDQVLVDHLRVLSLDHVRNGECVSVNLTYDVAVLHRLTHRSRHSCADKRVLDRDLLPGAFGCCQLEDADHDAVAVRQLDSMRLVRVAMLEVRTRHNR
jgi:hypothetical protein